MKHHFIVFLIAFLSVYSAAAAQPSRVPNREDVVCIVYDFTLTSDGKAHDIKVSQIFRQKDHSDASHLLTTAEKAGGASLISNHPYRPRPDQVGKKRYDFVLFDTKSRQCNRGARP